MSGGVMQPLPAFNEAVILVVVLVPFLATALARRVFWERAIHWADVRLLAAMYTLVALRVTIGYHGMLTHRSFRANQVVKYVLLILGSMSVQGPALEWATIHVRHHAQADRPGDLK